MQCDYEDTEGRIWTFEIGTDEHGPWWNLLTTAMPEGIREWKPWRIHISGDSCDEDAAKEAKYAVEHSWHTGAEVEGHGGVLISKLPLACLLQREEEKR